MPTNVIGQPANIENNLPTSKVISNATNATPIVVTTTTDHDLQTGDLFTVSDVAGNTAANGTWIAGAVTGTTVALLQYPAGTNTTGSGAYTSGGELLSHALPRFQTPSGSDKPSASAIGVITEYVGDATAWLAYNVGLKFDKAGGFISGPVTFLSGAHTSWDSGANVLFDGSGTVSFSGFRVVSVSSTDWDFESSANVEWKSGSNAEFESGSELEMEIGSTHKLQGREVRATRIALTDADHTVAVVAGGGAEVGTRFELPDPVAPQVITIKDAGNEGEIMEFFCANVTVAGARWTFQREGGTDIARFEGPGAVTTHNQCWLQVEKVSGVWRMGPNSGHSFDGTDPYGVIGETGA